MRCRRVRRLLAPYLEGELEARKVSEIEGHLEVCERCRQELALELAIRGMGVHPVPPVPEGFAEEVVLMFEGRKAEEEVSESISALLTFSGRAVLFNLKWTMELLYGRLRLVCWAAVESFVYTWRALWETAEATVEAVKLAYGPSAY